MFWTKQETMIYEIYDIDSWVMQIISQNGNSYHYTFNKFHVVLVIGIGHRCSILKVRIFLFVGIIYLYLFYDFFRCVGNVNFYKQA